MESMDQGIKQQGIIQIIQMEGAGHQGIIWG